MNEFYDLVFYIIISLMLGICFMFWFIPILNKMKFGQFERSEGLKSHLSKAGTPTMGGIVMIILSVLMIFSSCLLKKQVINYQIISILISIIGFGLIGFIDDYLIVVKKNNIGLLPKVKFVFQIMISVVLVSIDLLYSKELSINFFGVRLHLSFLYPIWLIIAFVAMSNATNLTDGIDGLLSSNLIISFTGILILAIYKHNLVITITTVSILVSLMTFLFFNSPKALVFMGDTGSLFLGAVMLILLVYLDCEILIFLFGFVYIVETVSVILQVWYFKRTNGNRLFKMAPIHHHFEIIGYSESIINLMYFIISLICVSFGVILGVRFF